MYKNNKGFTLIELLVVIAIIGILASLVLVALGNARDKANDARIKSNIGQLRTIAEIIYDSNGASYDNGTAGVEQCIGGTASATTCANADISTSVTTLQTDIDTADGTGTGVAAESLAGAFCIESILNDATYVCVDNTGATVTGHTAGQCDTTLADCAP